MVSDTENDYDIRICKILDARHAEDTGTNDEPFYNQSVQLLLEDMSSGVTFVAPLSEKDVRDISGLDFELTSKEMIEISQWLRDFEGQVKLLVPKKGNKINKDLLLNFPSNSASDDDSLRSASIKRFKFDKDKLKKAN